MINVGGTNLGKSVKILREARGMTRMELSEAIGISDAHLKKIEAGSRQPGFSTYQKMIQILEVDIVIKNEVRTVKGDCVVKAQEILMDCTEKQAWKQKNLCFRLLFYVHFSALLSHF